MLSQRTIPKWLLYVIAGGLLLALIFGEHLSSRLRGEQAQELEYRDTKIEKLEKGNKQLDTKKDKQDREIKNLKKDIKDLQKELQAKRVGHLYQASSSEVISKIQAKFGTDPRILALVKCESKFSTSVVSPIDRNGFRNVGLFQINLTHGQTVNYWQNIDNNIQKAWELSSGGTNWNPWPTCKYTAGLA